MLEPLKRYLRPLRYEMRRRQAEWKAATPGPWDDDPPPPPPRFIVGCGRSGTTILGRVFVDHPDVRYLFEPYHLWASVERRTDVTNLYYRVDGLFIMEGEHASPEARVRFNRLILSAREGTAARIVLEKTPHNVCRLGFIEALAPGARYVHLVRDGLHVCRSIERLASENIYRIAGRGRLNQWWGLDHRKWKALARDGAAAGYFGDELPALASHARRGAYEWLVSLAEADRHRRALGDRMLEMRYIDLTIDPQAALRTICEFFGVSCPDDWLHRAAARFNTIPRPDLRPVRLPPRMLEAFNDLQARYGFDGRAVPLKA